MVTRASFSDEDKEETNSNYFEQGVHKVKIESTEFGFTDDGKEYADVTVVDPENGEKKDKARVWFHSAPARKFSFNTLRAIFVHNAGENKKDIIRDKFNSISNTEELEKACAKMLPGKEAWFTVYESENRTYTDSSGHVRKSFDKNITGYEPKPRTVTVGTGDAKIEGEQVKNNDDPFGF